MSPRGDHLREALLESIPFEWKRIDEVINETVGLVPPGKALRKYQASYDASRKQRDKRINLGLVDMSRTGYARSESTESAKIRSGARTIVNDRTWSLAKYGVIEFYVDDQKVKWVRRVDRRKQTPMAVSEPGEYPVSSSTSSRASRLDSLTDGFLVTPEHADTDDDGVELWERLEGLAYHVLSISPSKLQLLLKVVYVDLDNQFTEREQIDLRPLLDDWVRSVLKRRAEPTHLTDGQRKEGG